MSAAPLPSNGPPNELERSATAVFDRFFDLSLDMLCIADMRGYFVRLNVSFTQILGWSQEELLARPFLSFVHPEDLDRTQAEFERIKRGTPTLAFHNRYRRRDGAYRWFSWKCAYSPSDALIYASARDVTDEIYIEEEMQRSEERFRMVVEGAPHALVMVNEQGLMTLVNSEAEQLFGYTRDELLNRSIDMLVPDRYRVHNTGMRDHFLLSPEAGSKGGARELHGRRRDGAEIAIEVGLSPLLTGDGAFVLASIIDITERKRVERLKSEFIAVISHELRTPLTSIRGSLGLVNGGVAGELPEKARRLVELAWRNTDRLAALINDILDFEKIESGEIPLEVAVHSLRALVEQAITANSGYAHSCGVRFTLTSGAADGAVNVDGGRLLQVLANLLSNAAKFSPEGATVSVDIAPGREAVRVSVSDEGPGVPEDFRSRLFHKFTQADSSDRRRKGGTGLGLAISKALIERMDGAIGYDSPPGRGATFFFDLKLATPTPA